jgi:hypothetical protein
MQHSLGSIIKNFLLGGVIMSIISYSGTFFSPLIGAIVWSFPSTLLPALYYMREHNKGNDYLARFALSSSYAVVLTIAAAALLSYFIKNAKQEDKLIVPILKMAVIWLITSGIFYGLVTYFDLESMFM